jgi:hypothetical protein
MLVGTLFGFLTVFQTGANATGLSLRRGAIFVVCIAVLGSLALTLVGGALIHGVAASTPEQWGILALDILTVASFALVITRSVAPRAKVDGDRPQLVQKCEERVWRAIAAGFAVQRLRPGQRPLIICSPARPHAIPRAVRARDPL